MKHIDLTRSWKHWLVAACMAASILPTVAQKKDTLVVDGNDWLSPSMVERRAFLVGAANMIIAEAAYAKRRDAAPPPVGERISQAAERLKIGDIEARVTRWYEANPGKLAMPVMGVVWQDIAKQRP